METKKKQQQQQSKPKRPHRLRRSLSSLMERSRSSSPNRSSTTTSAFSKSTTTLLFLPPAAGPTPPSSQPPSRTITPQRSLEHIYTRSIPQPMSYELPPGCPPPHPFHFPCYEPVPGAIHYPPSPPKPYWPSFSGEYVQRKPLPPTPLYYAYPGMNPTSSLPSSSSASAPFACGNAPRHLSIIPEATTPTTPTYPHTAAAELEDHPKELPGCYPTPPTSERGELPQGHQQQQETEFHVHASSVPDCEFCARQDEFWGFGWVVGLDVPMPVTPPPSAQQQREEERTKKEKQAEKGMEMNYGMPLTPPDTPEHESPQQREFDMGWRRLAQGVDRGRDITSWLLMTPLRGDSDDDDDEDNDDDNNINDNDEDGTVCCDSVSDSGTEDTDLQLELFRLEQELRQIGRGRRLENSMVTASVGRRDW